MNPELLVAAVIVLALMAYGALAGADFGGGVWDLLARGPRRTEQREAIAHAMAPVWEANHVWLIFVIVLLFTCFPTGFSALSIGLFVPLHLVLVGIILRGASFVFRAYGPRNEATRLRWGAVFGASSVITPALLGMCLGAASAGSLRVDGTSVAFEGGRPWLSPLALLLGAFALTLCAYVAAVFLTQETVGDLREDFRRRALGSGTVLVALSATGIPWLHASAPHLFAGLTSARALPVIVPGVLAALTSGAALWRRAWKIARIAAVLQVTLLIAGWALAQYPYLIYPDVTLASAAAPPETLRWVLWALIPGGMLLGPSLWLLFRVFKSAPRAN